MTLRIRVAWIACASFGEAHTAEETHNLQDHNCQLMSTIIEVAHETLNLDLGWRHQLGHATNFEDRLSYAGSLISQCQLGWESWLKRLRG